MDARNEIDDNLMLKDIEWCMEMISSNKLYDPLIMFKRNEDNMSPVKHKEVVTWIENYSKAQEISKNNNLLVPGGGPSRRGSVINRNVSSMNLGDMSMPV